MNVDEGCVTHHNACDCREKKIRKLIENLFYIIKHYKSYSNLRLWDEIKHFEDKYKELYGDFKNK
jgi:hypothetical protein